MMYCPTLNHSVKYPYPIATYPITLGAGETGGITINADGTETVGSNLVTGTDNDFSGAGNWTGATLGAFDVNSTVVGKMYMLGDGGSDYSLLSAIMTVGKTYKMTVKSELLAGASAVIYAGTGLTAANAAAGNCFAITPTGTESTYSGYFVASTTGLGIGVVTTGFTGRGISIDNVSIREVTSPAQNNITVEISRLTGMCTLSKTVSGTTTVLDASSVTYGDAKVLTVLHDADSELFVAYDGAKIYQAAVSDATIINNKRHYVSGDGAGTLTKQRLRYGSVENSGTSVSGTPYQIVTTEVDHFAAGYVVGDYWFGDGATGMDANNTVKKVNP